MPMLSSKQDHEPPARYCKVIYVAQSRHRKKYFDAHAVIKNLKTTAVTTVSRFSMFLQSATNLFEFTKTWVEVACCYISLALMEGGNTQKSHISVTKVPAKS